jgi:hypothetical protein
MATDSKRFVPGRRQRRAHAASRAGDASSAPGVDSSERSFPPGAREAH